MIDLQCGDCLELMKSIPDESIDMILCDLPYGTTRNRWDSCIDLASLWKQYKRIIKEHGCIALFGQPPFDKVLGVSNIKWLRYEWVYKKLQGTGHLNAKKMPMKIHENILIFYKNLPTYNPQWGLGKPYTTVRSGRGSSNYGQQHSCMTVSEDGRRYPVDVLTFGLKDRGLHPTQKPVELLEYLIKTYTNEGETVLDNCMGSGSTGVARVNTGRNFIGIELNQKYFNIARERINNAIV